MRSKGLGSIRPEMQANRIDPPAREQGYPRQGTNMVTDPVKNIVTNLAHRGVMISGREIVET
jgi:hypothetical protein